MKRRFFMGAFTALMLAACHRPSKVSKPPTGSPTPAAPAFRQEGMASWYQALAVSLPVTRAGEAKYYAASDSIARGCDVRVTRKDNGKSVIVRVTDRGIHQPRVVIDLCKAAAAELGMLKEGETAVTIEQLPPPPAR